MTVLGSKPGRSPYFIWSAPEQQAGAAPKALASGLGVMRKTLNRGYMPGAVLALPHNPLDVRAHDLTLRLPSLPETKRNPAFSAKLSMAFTLSEYLCWNQALHHECASAVAGRPVTAEVPARREEPYQCSSWPQQEILLC